MSYFICFIARYDALKDCRWLKILLAHLLYINPGEMLTIRMTAKKSSEICNPSTTLQQPFNKFRAGFRAGLRAGLQFVIYNLQSVIT